MGHPASEALSLVRRAAARIGELGVFLAFADQIGLIHGFVKAMTDPNTSTGAALTTALASFLFDLYEAVSRPDMTLRSCDDAEPRLPLE